MSFPLQIRVQIAPDANPAGDPAGWTWQTITQAVKAGGIRITRGRTDEAGTTQPGRVQLTVSADQTLRRGWPLRVQVMVDGAWNTRLVAIIDELAPRLVDGAVDKYVVDVQASGVMHRLAKSGAFTSPLSHALAASTVLAGWLPLEDPPGALRPAPGVSRQPLPTSRAVRFGQRDDRLPGASSVARLDASGSRITMPLPNYFTTAVNARSMATISWYWTASNLGDAHVDVLTSGSIRVRANEVGLTVDVLVGPTVVGTIFHPWGFPGVDPADGWVGIQVQLERPTEAPSMVVRSRMHAVGTTAWSTAESAPFSSSGVAGIVTSVTAYPAGGSGWSHLTAIQQPVSPDVDTAWPAGGYVGEDGAARLARVCATAGVPLHPDASLTGTAMGPQPAGSLLDVARDVEDADGGLLIEDRALGVLGYIRRVGRYNRPVTLALTYKQLAPPLAPRDDDRYTRNDWTVSRSDGGSARAVDAQHIDRYGLYDDSDTVNISSDGPLVEHAGWRVHLGTVEEYRYPTIVLNLRRPETLPLLATWAAAGIGHRITVTGVPGPMGDSVIDQHIDGYTETIDRFIWQVELNTSPASPWTIAVADGDARVAAEPDSMLAAPLAATASTMQIASGRLWTTDPADFPLDVLVGQEVMRLSAITGSASPQTATIASRTDSRAWPAGTPVDVRHAAVVPL